MGVSFSVAGDADAASGAPSAVGTTIAASTNTSGTSGGGLPLLSVGGGGAGVPSSAGATPAGTFTPTTPSKSAQRAATQRDGIFVSGLSIQQARWDDRRCCIADAAISGGASSSSGNTNAAQGGGEASSPIPALHLVPVPSTTRHGSSSTDIAGNGSGGTSSSSTPHVHQHSSMTRFVCPLYSTNIHDSDGGSKSSTSKAPYWVHDIPLPIEAGLRPEDWRIRGTALYLDPRL